MCGHPFPSTDTIPLVNDILYDTEDFSKINDDEINVMPSKFIHNTCNICKVNTLY